MNRWIPLLGLACGLGACTLVELTNGQRPPAGEGGGGEMGGAGPGGSGPGPGGSGGGGEAGAGGAGGEGGGPWANGLCSSGPPGSQVDWVCHFGNDEDQDWSQSRVRLASHPEGVVLVASTAEPIAFGDEPRGDVGRQNVFVVSFDRDGHPRWSQALTGTATNKSVADVAVSPVDGSIAVAGWYENGNLELDGVAIAARGIDGYLFVFEADGTPRDARLFREVAGEASINTQRAFSVAFDDAGALYVGGEYRGQLAVRSMDGTTDANAGCALSSTAAMNMEGYVLKLEPGVNGGFECAWARKIGGALNERTTTVAALPNGGVAAGGYFRNVVTVDTTPPFSYDSPDDDSDDGFVLVLGDDGSMQAGGFVRIGGLNTDQVTQVRADGDSLHVVGHLSSGSTTMPGCDAIQVRGGDRDAFVAQILLDGAMCTHATKIASESSDDDGLGVATSAGWVGVVGIAGRDLTAGNVTMPYQGARDGFLMMLDVETGTPMHALPVGSLGDDAARAIAPVMGSPAFYVAGMYGGPIDELGLPRPTAPEDYFLARVRVP
ncbi:hypothetical protein [Chondromyces crocatus]|uniref:Uncharacterized protein n=1 Tax=Chondromyces crocatus TaxID=52 RepID=A0A0K1EEF6_CHOCO|nr:hypothetical protein [Chondromyces crocatus]AKT39255.1 uncharacterized protein CMC5_034030 [Chondromyces crocatus]